MMSDLRDNEGNIVSDDPLTVFLYVLLRDHLPTGVVEEIINKHTYQETTTFTNRWLAEYAKDLAARLQVSTPIKLPDFE
jgi:hypothetical protein